MENLWTCTKIRNCFICDFFIQTGNEKLIEKYGLQPFSLNTLDKRQTLTEKSVSLIRFSLSDNYLYDLTAKVRHFYDLYYLLQDNDCLLYLHSGQFCKHSINRKDGEGKHYLNLHCYQIFQLYGKPWKKHTIENCPPLRSP